MVVVNPKGHSSLEKLAGQQKPEEAPPEASPKPKKQASREGTAQVAIHMPKDAVYAFGELLFKLSRQRGRRVTLQDAVTEAVAEFAEKHGVTLPLTPEKSTT